MLSYAVDTITGVNLGQQGEHLVHEIRIDVSSWLEIEPELGVHIVATRHGETVPYVAATTLEGTELVWPITSYDTGVEGAGWAAVIGAYDSQIKKSRRFRTTTGNIVPGSDEDETPEPYTGWLDQIIAAGQEVLSAENRVYDAIGEIYEVTESASAAGELTLRVTSDIPANSEVLFAVISTGNANLTGSISYHWYSTSGGGNRSARITASNVFVHYHKQLIVQEVRSASVTLNVGGSGSVRFAVATGAKADHLMDELRARQSAVSASNAASSASAAAASATAAETSATAAATSAANAATSEANAEHYADLAQQGAEESGFVFFDVNDEDGHMYVTMTDNIARDVSFAINEQTGHLEVIYSE